MRITSINKVFFLHKTWDEAAVTLKILYERIKKLYQSKKMGENTVL
ncbi:MAG: hypothetical protein ABI402_11850 [Ferruginibacter sp.]